MKVQIFFASDADELQRTFEELINGWLSNHPNIKIKFIAQSECEKELTISIFYIEDVMKSGVKE